MSRFAHWALTRAALFLFILIAPFASAIGRGDFDRVVDYSVTLKTIAAAASGAATLPQNKYFVLDGTVAELTILDKEQASFSVRVQLLSGEWIGMEEVKSYGCYVTFSGPEFFNVFPARAPKNPDSTTVLVNSRVLVVARPLEMTTTPQGEKLLSLEGLYVRVLQ